MVSDRQRPTRRPRRRLETPFTLTHRDGYALADDDAAEAAWAPVLGPTATALWRRLGTVPAGVTIEPDDLAAALGVGRPAIANAVDRLVRFRVVTQPADAVFEIPAFGSVLPTSSTSRTIADYLQPTTRKTTP